MLRRPFIFSLSALLLSILLTILTLQFIHATKAYADSTPILTLNRQQGPLGVTLILSGKNFPPGNAGLSYIDAQSVPGVFGAPGDTSVQVQGDGTFITRSLLMPESGPVGSWKILVTNSLGSVSTINYGVLAAPGEPTAGAPGLTLIPTNGISGDAITFNGTNWFPQGTVVNLLLQVGTNSIPLLEPSPISNKNGTITGTFHLPSNLSSSQANVIASDASTGALRAQTPILINGASPTPTSSPTVQASPSPTVEITPTSQPTSIPSPGSTVTPVTTDPGGSDNAGGSLTKFNGAVWGPVLLVVGGVLGVAALMLVLFMLPWGQRKSNESHGGQF